ncbi:Hypothetical protein FKW44_006049, partial [Caligus rogercresseyi]
HLGAHWKTGLQKSHSSTKALKASITKAWSKMEPTYIKNTCSSFRPVLWLSWKLKAK